MHQDKNCLYLYQKTKQHNSEYSYRRGIGEFFITWRGEDIEVVNTMKEVNERLKELRYVSSISDIR